MSPYAEPGMVPSLAAKLQVEWRRVALLCQCLMQLRKGVEPDDAMKENLSMHQQAVMEFRATGWWKELAEDHDLTQLDLELAIFAAAPSFDAQIGWMMHSMQPGRNEPYPAAALIGELLFFSAEDMPLIHARLTPESPLRAHGFIEGGLDDVYEPLRPSKAFIHLLRGTKPGRVIPSIPGATYIEKQGRLNDLVASDNCLRVLDEFIRFERHREQVENDWGGTTCGGPVALFSGPSGTGKTFAAAVVANELGYPLFRVDLGLLVSKYIGETEKNLSALFDTAAGRKVVLLFDEADSLFGKRGEVRDARDRYANMEVSHLLSRIEHHRGPCILTTNLRRHLDPAFARRFQMCVEFPRPEEKDRVRLWEKLIPADAPLADDVDWKELGRELSLTGAQIRNATIHAACCAAGDGEPISRRHVARAVFVELSKEGKEVVPSSLGSLRGCLP